MKPDDFDPASVLDGWHPPAPPPVDLDLGRLLDNGRAAVDEAKKARLEARGYSMRDIQDVELPQRPPPSRPAVMERPLVSMQAQPSRVDARVLERWQPGAWIVLTRRLRGACTDVVTTRHGPQVEHHAPQWLCALWPPQGDGPLQGRWPEMATVIGAETAFGALQQLLPVLPPGAPLWPGTQEVDWALLADLVRHHDARLRSDQAQALRELAEAERSASIARLSDGYLLRDRFARRRHA
ncbi:MAG: hypothetical protein EOP35_00310 [Rubrivivax sp.]|nr:MAG: hypothetical protein EOP35_00310 [Rubrivivax sp.]